MTAATAPGTWIGRLLRSWRLTLGLALLAVVVSAVATTGALDRRDDGLKDCARMVARNELLRLHWKSLEHDRGFRQVIDAMCDSFAADPMDTRWTAKIIAVPARPADVLDAFETAALEQIRAGKAEVWESSKRGGSRYARAIRDSETCIACHRTDRNQVVRKEGDLIGVVSLVTVPAKAKP